MALPWSFANATTLFTSRLDDNDNALGALTVIPCTATGTNTILLTPAANTPTISAYTNLSPVFAFLAAASNSGTTTININGIGAKNLYKNNGATLAGTGDIISGGLYLISYNSALNGAVGGFVIDNPATSLASLPTGQRLTASGTYTPTAGTVKIRVRMVGSGGGGGARTTNFGVGGGTTTFGSWTALGGSGGAAAGGSGGAGGTGGANGTGNLIYRVDGFDGAAGGQTSVANVLMAGGVGGNSMLGSGAAVNNGTGATARANSGGGGQGAGGSGTNAASGGGGGEYVEFWVNNPTATSFTISPGGAGGAAGVLAGGAGGSGFILVDEYYQ